MRQSNAAGEPADLLTANEVAEMLRVHPTTVMRWAAEGAFEAVRLPGRAVRFRRSDIDAILARPVDAEAKTS